MLEAVIKARFREGNGKDLVTHGQWQLFDSKYPNRTISENNWQLFPDMSIAMAMILPRFGSEMKCPKPGCQSVICQEVPGGGMKW